MALLTNKIQQILKIKSSTSSGDLVIGSIIPFTGITVPRGYLLCDGRAVSRTDYSELFSVIGTTYGEGDGSTTFNVPNLINKFIEGSSTVGTVKEPGLPNITGGLPAWGMGQNNVGDLGHYSSNPLWSGSIGRYSDNADAKRKGIGASSENNRCLITGFEFNASKSNPIYGNSETVQPASVTCLYIIKAFDTSYSYQLEIEIDTGEKWIDGITPIYLWVVKCKTPSVSKSVITVYYTDYFYNNNCTIISVDGYIFSWHNNSYLSTIPINFARCENSFIHTHWNSNDPTMDTRGLRQYCNTEYLNCSEIVFLKYIKKSNSNVLTYLNSN